jgi:DNA phosphorothioation-associated putative methyltransferase
MSTRSENSTNEFVGKRVRDRLYVHVDAVEILDDEFKSRITRAEQLVGRVRGRDFNVVKVDVNGPRVSLLSYAAFFDDPFPTLRRSWGVDLRSERTWERSFETIPNPPILHRKELLLSTEHPRYNEYAAITRELEIARLFGRRGIGFRRQWYELLSDAGYQVSGNQLIRTTPSQSNENAQLVERHKTALTRYRLSTPMRALAESGYLDGQKTIFDYGCGKGDDVRILRENSVQASGWDPHFFPQTQKETADVVNLGFVINVIEDPEERAAVLTDAFRLANQLLVVSAMLESRRINNGETLADGVRTTRNTFQKYYSQEELALFIRSALGEEPVALSPGIFYVFKDKAEEQRFLVQRQRSRATVHRLITSISFRSADERQRQWYEQHKQLLDQTWETCLSLGRRPDRAELDKAVQIEALFGSLGRAYRFLEHFHGSEPIQEAWQARRDDFRVYFALLQFERRRAYKYLPEELQRDIRAFFGNYRCAREEGSELLFSAGNVEIIREACQRAADAGMGWMDGDNSFQLHKSVVEELPPVLRVYIGCGLHLYGELSAVDLIKIHIESGKLTLMSFDDFEGTPLPRMLERIKIKLRDQDIEFFQYGGDFAPPYLYEKSRYIRAGFTHYEEQAAFDRKLAAVGVISSTRYGPPPDIFDERLAQLGLRVEGFKLKPSDKLPALNAPCGKYLKFRDFIECGETRKRTGIPNLPKEPETYQALLHLAVQILDPVMDYFGGIKLTYGFCSPELAKEIQAGIAPKLDQHASHELNHRGQPICERLGAAIDFIVPDEDMLEVAQWIAQHAPFDRLYFYGADRPVHVSAGPEEKREVVVIETKLMSDAKPRRIPRVVGCAAFVGNAGDAG